MQFVVVVILFEVEMDFEIILLANFIILMLGMLSIDVFKDWKMFYVYEVYVKVGDIESVRW